MARNKKAETLDGNSRSLADRWYCTVIVIPLILIRCLDSHSKGGKMQGHAPQTREKASLAPRHVLYCLLVVASPFLDSLSLSRSHTLFLFSSVLSSPLHTFCHSFTSPILSSLLGALARATLDARTHPSTRCATWSCYSDRLESKWASVCLTMSRLDVRTFTIN